MTLVCWLRSAFSARSAGKSPRVRRLWLEPLEDRTTPSGGGLLDPTFGSGGTVLNHFTTSPDTLEHGLTDVVALPGGKLLTAGIMNQNFAAARYNADGGLDTSFGNGGLATVDFKGGYDRATAVAVQPGSGGKVLLAGTAYDRADTFGVVRLNPDGSLDTTFGGSKSGGKVTVSPVATMKSGVRVANQVTSMAVLPDGRFVLAGLARNLPSTTWGSLVLARYNANGTLDASFGSGGTVVTTITVQGGANQFEHVVNVALDGSGRLVVSGSEPHQTGNLADFLVARFNANGSLDTTFGPSHTGVVTTDLESESYDRAYAMALQGDGKIVLGGFANPAPNTLVPVPFALVRYNPDGSLDTSFDQDGIATAEWDTYPGHISQGTPKAVVIQSDGEILLAGDGGYYTAQGDGTYDYSGNMVVLMRFNADGSRDLSYGPSGTAAVATSLGYNAIVSAMDLQADGRAVVVGKMNVDGTVDPRGWVNYFALTRFLGPVASPTAVQVGSFTASSNTVAAGNPVTLTAGGVTTANAGATATAVAFYSVDSSGTEQLLGYGTENADGTWTLTFAADLAPGPYTLLALAVDSTGAVSDPLALMLTVQ